MTNTDKPDSNKPDSNKQTKQATRQQDRLKDNLRANLQKRKNQARARKCNASTTKTTDTKE